MIYVSSSCVKANKIGEAVEQLAKAGFSNIELSGGTQPYPELETDLLALKEKYNLIYLCHNYFPPPIEHFVLNLASLDEKIEELSVSHLQNAIALSEKLGAKKFGFHAGFLINIPVNQIGKSIVNQQLFDKNKAIEKFWKNYNFLFNLSNEVELYIENNVLSATNYHNYNQQDPFLATTAESINNLLDEINANLLLDVAHLKVSCKTLNKDFAQQLSCLSNSTDYIHISDNDALNDSNQAFEEESELFRELNKVDFRGKTITLEVYSGLDNVRKSYQAAEKLIYG